MVFSLARGSERPLLSPPRTQVQLETLYPHLARDASFARIMAVVPRQDPIGGTLQVGSTPPEDPGHLPRDPPSVLPALRRTLARCSIQ